MHGLAHDEEASICFAVLGNEKVKSLV